MKTRITITDVAYEAKVSISTASKAMNGSGNISSSTVKAVSEAAKKLGYRPNRAARMLSRKNKTIGVLLTAEPVEVMSLFEHGIIDSADEYGEFGIKTEILKYIKGSGEFEKKLSELAETDCAVIVPEGNPESCAESLSQLNIPKLTLQTGIYNSEICRGVSVNERVVGMMAAEYLSMTVSKRSVAVICGDSRMHIHRMNIEGFKSELDNNRLVLSSVLESFDDMNTAKELTCKLIKEHPETGGIFVTSYVAPAVCEALGSGSDIKVIGVDVYEATVKCINNGTLGAVIYQNQEAQAKRAMELAVGILNGDPLDGKTIAEDVKIKPELVMRTNLECYI